MLFFLLFLLSGCLISFSRFVFVSKKYRLSAPAAGSKKGVRKERLKCHSLGIISTVKINSPPQAKKKLGILGGFGGGGGKSPK